ncbi:MAG: cytochrome c biogenesis protein CcsA [Phycisphaerales bacterium]|nr:cytochrome c biogenesis protein CcsA [Phycisphaerales bacterium]
MLTAHRTFLTTGYWILTGLLFVCGLAMLAITPSSQEAFGPAQKIFFIHLPTAICTFIAASTLFIASVGYLWSRTMKWDDLANASGKVTVLLCTIVLLTGIIWGKSEWGSWWTWSPRLTFSLVLWVLYIVYLIIRPMIHSPTRRATISAVYGLAAFIDVPLVYMSVKLIPDIHPSSVELDPTMQITLLIWFLAIPLMTAGLIAAGCSLNTRERAMLETSATNTQSQQEPINTNTGSPS